ncbi:MAG: hypothetical protein J3K34DRAFT_200649 [Monoraphidium minutum]|nr:MAG: hypothetical protein J3K34DRAFT_200649 [Monoraphidium minutum]
MATGVARVMGLASQLTPWTPAARSQTAWSGFKFRTTRRPRRSATSGLRRCCTSKARSAAPAASGRSPAGGGARCRGCAQRSGGARSPRGRWRRPPRRAPAFEGPARRARGRPRWRDGVPRSRLRLPTQQRRQALSVRPAPFAPLVSAAAACFRRLRLRPRFVYCTELCACGPLTHPAAG